jgi:hypothetical protein
MLTHHIECIECEARKVQSLAWHATVAQQTLLSHEPSNLSSAAAVYTPGVDVLCAARMQVVLAQSHCSSNLANLANCTKTPLINDTQNGRQHVLRTTTSVPKQTRKRHCTSHHAEHRCVAPLQAAAQPAVCKTPQKLVRCARCFTKAQTGHQTDATCAGGQHVNSPVTVYKCITSAAVQGQISAMHTAALRGSLTCSGICLAIMCMQRLAPARPSTTDVFWA